MITAKAPVNLPDNFNKWSSLRVNVFCALLDYICDSANKHLEALGHLESNHSGIVLANVMYSFMNFK